MICDLDQVIVKYREWMAHLPGVKPHFGEYHIASCVLTMLLNMQCILMYYVYTCYYSCQIEQRQFGDKDACETGSRILLRVKGQLSLLLYVILLITLITVTR